MGSKAEYEAKKRKRLAEKQAALTDQVEFLPDGVVRYPGNGFAFDEMAKELAGIAKISPLTSVLKSEEWLAGWLMSRLFPAVPPSRDLELSIAVVAQAGCIYDPPPQVYGPEDESIEWFTRTERRLVVGEVAYAELFEPASPNQLRCIATVEYPGLVLPADDDRRKFITKDPTELDWACSDNDYREFTSMKKVGATIRLA